MSFSGIKFTRQTAATMTCLAAVTMFGLRPAQADLVSVTVEVTNHAPTGGVYLSPFWVGFHNGSFDTYDVGAASSIQLSRLAEDGNASPLAQTFAQNGSLSGASTPQVGQRVQGTLMGTGGAIAPGETVAMEFQIDPEGANQYLSFASMVLPSSDYFIANEDPWAIDLAALAGPGGGAVMFNQSHATDAGTEINDFATSAGNGLFPTLDLPVGQTGPNQGADQYGVSADVMMPFAGFANTPAGADTNPDFGALNFSNGVLYSSGLASITVTAIPEPMSIGAAWALLIGLMGRRKRLKAMGV